MKAETKKILKDQNRLDVFTDEKFAIIKDAMKYAMSRDEWLRNYLPLDPLNKAQWCADHLIKLSNLELKKTTTTP